MRGKQLYQSFSISYEKLDSYPNRKDQQHFFELIYIINGKGKRSRNQYTFDYHQGDLFLVRPQDSHGFEIEKKSEFFFLRFNNIYIESGALRTDNIERLEYILQNTKRRSRSILDNRTDKNLVRAVVKALIKETKDKELYNTELVEQLVNTLIIIVARNIAKNLSETVSENTDGRIIKILNYIQIHIYEPEKLRTKAISQHFNISENYMGRYFKKHCNETLQNYIIQCKMSLIEKRLKHSEKRINEIVTELGFTDESHLNKFFKQQRGISPSLYRNGS